MNWIFGNKYKLWVINTSSKAEIYLWKNWHLISPNINNLLNLSNHPSHIRTFQSFGDNKWLGFGRMKWNEENNLKWTTKYRSEAYNDKELQFLGTEIWAPDWNQCSKTGKTPEVFIQIYHYPNLKKIREGIVIAMPQSIVKKNESSIKSNIEKIMERIPNSTLSEVKRYWSAGRKFVNKIEDINNWELEKIVYQKE